MKNTKLNIKSLSPALAKEQGTAVFILTLGLNLIESPLVIASSTIKCMGRGMAGLGDGIDAIVSRMRRGVVSQLDCSVREKYIAQLREERIARNPFMRYLDDECPLTGEKAYVPDHFS